MTTNRFPALASSTTTGGDQRRVLDHGSALEDDLAAAEDATAEDAGEQDAFEGEEAVEEVEQAVEEKEGAVEETTVGEDAADAEVGEAVGAAEHGHHHGRASHWTRVVHWSVTVLPRAQLDESKIPAVLFIPTEPKSASLPVVISLENLARQGNTGSRTKGSGMGRVPELQLKLTLLSSQPEALVSSLPLDGQTPVRVLDRLPLVLRCLPQPSSHTIVVERKEGGAFRRSEIMVHCQDFEVRAVPEKLQPTDHALLLTMAGSCVAGEEEDDENGEKGRNRNRTCVHPPVSFMAHYVPLDYADGVIAGYRPAVWHTKSRPGWVNLGDFANCLDAGWTESDGVTYTSLAFDAGNDDGSVTYKFKRGAFPFFGQMRESVIINANGWVVFDPSAVPKRPWEPQLHVMASGRAAPDQDSAADPHSVQDPPNYDQYEVRAGAARNEAENSSEGSEELLYGGMYPAGGARDEWRGNRWVQSSVVEQSSVESTTSRPAREIIAVYWTDLKQASVTVAEGDDEVIIQWNNVELFDDLNHQRFSFQLLLTKGGLVAMSYNKLVFEPGAQIGLRKDDYKRLAPLNKLYAHLASGATLVYAPEWATRRRGAAEDGDEDEAINKSQAVGEAGMGPLAVSFSSSNSSYEIGTIDNFWTPVHLRRKPLANGHSASRPKGYVKILTATPIIQHPLRILRVNFV